MLVDPEDSGVDDRVLEIRVVGEVLEDLFKDAFQGPSAEALEDRVPVAEPVVEVAPARARAGDPQHGLEKEPVIVSRAARVAHFTGQQGRDALPLLITQNASLQGWPPFSSLEADFARQGKPPHSPECQQALISLAPTPAASAFSGAVGIAATLRRKSPWHQRRMPPTILELIGDDDPSRPRTHFDRQWLHGSD